VAANKQTRKPTEGLRQSLRLALRLGFEIAIGLAVVLASWLEQRHDPPPTLGLPWVLFWAFTILIFAPPVTRYLSHWRQVSFWVVVGGLLVIHTAWWTSYIRSWFFGPGFQSWHFPILVWMLWGLVEYGAIRALFYWRYSPDRQAITLGAFIERRETTTKPGR